MAARINKRERVFIVEPLEAAVPATAAVASAQCATANGSDPATTQALANDLKVKYNAAQLEIVELRATVDALAAALAAI